MGRSIATAFFYSFRKFLNLQSKTFSFSSAALLPLLLLAVSLPASGADSGNPRQETEVITIPEMVVTATRYMEEVRKVPANVTVITAADIRKSGATTIPEILERLEGINFRSYSGNASKAMIDVRGFGGDNPYGRTLVMLDGRRLNRPDMSSINWLQIPLSNIEKIEIVRGAGSALYGDSAIGGVINIITLQGTGSPEARGSVILGSYGLHDEQAGFSGSSKKLSYSASAENQKSYGYRERSKFSSQGGGLRIGYDSSEKLALDLNLSFTQTDYDLPGSLTKTQVELNRRKSVNPDDDASERYLNANVNAESFWGSYGRLSVPFLYGQRDLKANMTSWGVFNNNLLETYGLTPKYILERDLLGHPNKIIIGLDYYYDTLGQDRFGTRERTAQTALVDLKKESLGYYVRDEFGILKDFYLSAGYRTERARIKGKDTGLNPPAQIFEDEKVHHAEAYETGITWLIGERSKLFAKYATVYRIPFTDEQAVYSGYGLDVFLTDLDKEKGKSYEAGAVCYPLENLRMGLTVFRINMEDEIVWVGDWLTGHNENLDKTKHEGIEGSLAYEWKGLGKFFGNFSYQAAKFEAGVNNGKTVPLVPEWKANAALEIYLPYGLTLRPEIRYASDAYSGGDNANTGEKIKSYTFYDLSLLYRRGFNRFGLSAFFKVENLTDEKYDLILYNGSAYYPYPGITLKSGISVDF
jgi:iron complex outermembrane receptor protein